MVEGPCTDEGQTEDQKLQLLLKNLEHEWDFIKKTPEKPLYRTSTGSRKTIKTLGLLDQNTPGILMSSSPLEESAWKVRTNDLAVEVMLQERRAASKLIGMRLFEDETEEIGLVEESEVRSVFSYEPDDIEDENWPPRKEHLPTSYPHSFSSLCGAETVERGSGPQMAEKNIECDFGSGRVAKLNVIKVSIAISLIVFIFGIISTGSFGIYEDEELILTPT